eukprot:Phypoly_transcript_12459.p1 GENE.Phypoly_transcript_12459~~Phypoly_transcript_12459.p1  ORF type:complete len:193 (-),score=19.40 Phypoly_transcript_12459:145-723(-)
MFGAGVKRGFFRYTRVFTLATGGTIATIAPAPDNEPKSAEEYVWVPQEPSTLRTHVVTPAREFIWNAYDTVETAKRSFSDGFTNTTHKAAGAVDIAQVRDFAKSTRDILNQMPAALTVTMATLLPALIFWRKSVPKALFASTLCAGIATTQVYPGLLDSGARRLLQEYQARVNPAVLNASPSTEKKTSEESK